MLLTTSLRTLVTVLTLGSSLCCHSESREDQDRHRSDGGQTAASLLSLVATLGWTQVVLVTDDSQGKKHTTSIDCDRCRHHLPVVFSSSLLSQRRNIILIIILWYYHHHHHHRRLLLLLLLLIIIIFMIIIIIIIIITYYIIMVGVPPTHKLRPPWWKHRAIKGSPFVIMECVRIQLCVLRLLS